MPDRIKTRNVVVTILNRQFSVVCPINREEDLRKAEAYLNQKMVALEKKHRFNTIDQLATLIALNSVVELFLQKSENNSNNNYIDINEQLLERIKQLHLQVDWLLKNSTEQEEKIPETIIGLT